MVLLLTPHPLSYYFKPKKGRTIFPLNCATICNDSFKSEYVTSPSVTYGGKCFRKREPPVKKTVSSQRRRLPIFLICRGPCTQRDRFILTSSGVLSCLLKVGCGGSPVLQLPVLFGKLGIISHISWPKIWGRGESIQRSDFTTGAKVCEHVRKRCASSVRESEKGRRPQEHVVDPSLTVDVLLAGGERPRALCAGDCVRQYMTTRGSACGNSSRKPCPTQQCCQVHAGQIKGVLLRVEHSSSKGQPSEAALPAILPRADAWQW